MFLVCANHEDDFAVLAIENSEEEAEKAVVKNSLPFLDPGYDLVKIRYQGDLLYTVRYKSIPIPDEYEYIDNDGNPINADGSDIVEGAPVVEDNPYEYFTTTWIVKSVASGQPIELSASEHYLFSTGLQHPFTNDENLTIVASTPIG